MLKKRRGHKNLGRSLVLLGTAALAGCWFAASLFSGTGRAGDSSRPVPSSSEEPFALPDATEQECFVISASDLDSGYPETVYEGRNAVYVEAGSSVSFTALAPRDGIYHMRVIYFQPEDVLMTTRAAVSVNGVRVQSNMKLPVLWENNTEYETDEFGNELCRMPERIFEWTEHTLNHSMYQYRDGADIELKAGENHLEIEISETPLYIAEIVLYRGIFETDCNGYAASASAAKERENISQNPWIGVIEGEAFSVSNSAQIHAAKSKDSNLFPFDPAVNRVNALDGTSWNDAGDMVTWRFTVPEDGYYAIAVRYRLDQKQGLSSYRHIYIDGQVPFSEFYSYPFEYTGSGNKNEIISAGGGAAWFYFTAGEHEIRMETTAEVYSEIDGAVRHLVADMNRVALDVRAVTGGKTDTDRDWNIEKYLPNLREDLSGLLTQMDELEFSLGELDEAQPVLATVKTAYAEVEKFLDQEDGLDRLINNLSGFAQSSGSIAESVSQISAELLNQPLAIDRLYITSDLSLLPDANQKFWQSAWDEIRKMYCSFTVDTDQAQSVGEGLNVWMIGSAPQVEILRQMAARRYAKGEVNISILQDETKLLLAVASGETPDVILGGSRTKPYDLGVRGAVYDLTQFADFQEYASSFESEYFVPFIQGDAVYALPQTVNFYVMFYRSDILDSLGLTVPQTWNEMIDILPALYRRGMTVNTTIANAGSVKPMAFTYPYIAQQGGVLYTEEGSEILLGDVETMQAFTLMTDLYTKYSMPTTVGNFYLSFRNGIVPLGMSDVGTYLLLRELSTEISDSWGIAAGLGTVLADGSVNRDYPAVQTPCYILQGSRQPEQAWEFLKWWMDAETQLEYAETLCATYGDAYLWMSANLEALEGISSVPAADKAVILEQLRHTAEVPSHPAGAFVERALSNAWNSVVLLGEDPRTSLDTAVIEENREIRYKLQELGFLDADGKVLRQLGIADSEKARQLTGGAP